MPIVNSLISLFNLKRLGQIDDIRRNPIPFQEETFKQLIKKAENTQWGQKYGFKSIDSVTQFQQNVPISSYDDIKTWIERMIAGEENVLWPKEVKWFAKSSGTTSDKSKFIPVSKESLEDCHFRAMYDVFALYSDMVPETKIYSGKSLTLGGSYQVSKLGSRTQVGDLSAIYIQNCPFLADLKRTPDAAIALISEFEQKLQKIAEVSILENVTSIAGVPSWNMVLLKYILEQTGKTNLLEIWPNLEVFVHGGINFEPYRAQYKEIIPNSDMNYMETYNASEGFFAIQDDLSEKGMLLMPDYGIFYEFIPFEDLELAYPRYLTMEQVELNKNYALVISTNGGLWRYLIGDTVKFVSLFPHRIIISGRTKQFINVFGEELMVDNAEQGLKIACQKCNAVVSEYTVAPVFMKSNEQGRHQWVIEFEKSPENIETFARELDIALQSINSDYEAKRYKNITLAQLDLTIAPHGVFMEWMRRRGKLGGQNKVPRLSNTRVYVEELLDVIHHQN